MLATCAAAFGQAPVNDDFDDRISLGSAVNFTVNGSTVNATTQGGDELEVGGNGNSVWWGWTPAVDGTYTVSTVGSDFDPVLYVYVDDATTSLYHPVEGSLIEVGSSNNVYEDQAQVVIEAVAGVEHFIMVRGNLDTEGAVRLSLLQGENVTDIKDENILLRNTANGQLAMWGMDFDYDDGFELDEGGVLSPTFLPTSWRLIQHCEDFAGGEFDDYQQVLLHGPGNQLVYWAMGGAVVGYGIVPTPAVGGGGVWRLRGFVDSPSEAVFAPRDNDLIWQNTLTGQLVIWYMDASEAFTSAVVVTPFAGAANELKVVDFDEDDLWLQNKFNGRLFRWDLDGIEVDGTMSVHDTSVVNVSAGSAWELLGSDDFSAEASLYFRNRYTGQGASWVLNEDDDELDDATFWQISPPASWEMVQSSMD